MAQHLHDQIFNSHLHRLAKQQSCTILLVTHDIRILDIADSIVHMKDGRLTRDTALVDNSA
ncbi:abc exporter atp-binding family [Leptolyngbya sp. Heron Island J]|uniref:ABC transporter ATP-binding protein n=1 Tax=Leptolyngbya sp. Heron Island J TaxID=1385935 RepID=UPI0003B9C074|nr:ABC transporter ATP-binding protein [Leptolyngbya sp. Heron Island J]ESA37659.1 abc exporter atp-binding family [Leptolyngbya sp. Heron Island J]